MGWGVRAVISTSFADIFRNNALKNGLLAVEVDQETLSALRDLVSDTSQAEVTIDLETQRVSFGNGRTVQFALDPFARHCLLEGVDQLGYLLSKEDEIRAFEARPDASCDCLLRIQIPPALPTRLMEARIVVLPGDRIGPEVIAEGMKVLRRWGAI
jgi:3-isopropylmalate/(R)-2-methylmalate dehydratase small subunit